MKFRCDSCGKRFASVDEPFPGRVYKIRCGRCGRLLTVQAPVPWEPPAEMPAPRAPPPAAALVAPGPGLPATPAEVARAPATVPEAGALAPVVLWPRPEEETEEIPIDLALSDEYPLIRRRRRERFVLVTAALGGTALAALLTLGYLLQRSRAPEAVESTTVDEQAVVDDGGAGPGAAPASVTDPGTESGTDPVTASRPDAGSAAASPAGTGPATTPPPARRKPRTTVPFERQDASPPREPDLPPPPPPAGVDPDLAEALLRKGDAAVRTGLPDPTELQALLDGRRAALDACFDYAASTAGGAAWQGRSAQLLVQVEASGRASARLDDVALESTEIAACLRRTAVRTAFPAFTGEPVELRVQVGGTR